MIGIGSKEPKLSVYIANRPPISKYLTRTSLESLTVGELAYIVNETGNHWRKIFNIYAKLGFMLEESKLEAWKTWQDYRDTYLLQEGSQQALLFDLELVTKPEVSISLICGKAHALSLVDKKLVTWLDDDFAIDKTRRLIICPYFDYRQLSNIKLERLVEIIRFI